MLQSVFDSFFRSVMAAVARLFCLGELGSGGRDGSGARLRVRCED